MSTILEQIKEFGIIPVVAIDEAEHAIPLAKALRDGGLNCAEITFRTDAAASAIQQVSEKFPDMVIGAGTVLTIGQVDQAVELGARFIVSPGLNPKVVKHCVDNEIPIIPGCSTPSDVEQAIEQGLSVVKFFPAEQAGGLDYIKAIAAPYVDVNFLPTGGITATNVKKYLAYDRIIACADSWMVLSELIREEKFEEITSLVKEAVEIVKEVRG